ncbi:hypothetical protein N8T08_007758 [Aspergillus melleus]|uniref:Uncharacterized protein n=1 Tax=Aspergillus melleus TaxID=138277 RepID=A0ACC3BFC4_9EURO|nr:hypothetical protein N8T08_007758 [Aspergillus melleus]
MGHHDTVDITSGSQFSGLTTFARIPYINCFLDEESGKQPYDIAILGAPFDTAVTGRPGARFGPGGIRLGSHRLGGWSIYTGDNVYESWAKLVDCGDAPLTWLDNTAALKQLDLVHKVVSSRPANTTDLGRVPRIVTLGGDHTTTLSALRSTYEKWGPVSVIHFDSHIGTGWWNLPLCPSGVNHGTFLHIAHEEGLIRNSSIHVGLRAPVNRGKSDLRNDIRCGFDMIKARDIDRLGINGVVEQIKSRVRDSRVYISVDIDVLDPAYAPATGTAEPGRFTSRELLSILDGLRGLPVVGGDVVEVAPIYDTAGETTTLAAAEVVNSLLGLMGTDISSCLRDQAPIIVTMAENDENAKVFAPSTREDALVEQLGYEQELKRTFGLLGMIGFSFSVVTSWTALSGVFIVGVKSGGPPVMVFSFIAVCFLTLAVAIPMAEMCSILAMGATNNSIGANFILGMANLVFPEYTIQRWQTVLVAYCVAFISASVNIWGPHLLNRIARFILIWNVGSFLITMITLLATNDNKQSASFVFHDFQNFTGWGSSMAAIVGILQACFGMCCYDAPSHMTEEMKSASKEAPKAIILSVVLGAVTGFAFLLTLCFCIGDIDTTANTSTGVPVIQIFYDSTGNKVGTCFLSSMVAVIVLVAGNNLLAEGSRSVYAFARDNGLPFSSVLAKVDPKRQVPVNAVLLTLVVQLALDAIDFGTTTGFETVIAISTEGFYVSYAIALASRLMGYVTSHNPTMKGPFALPTAL